MGIPLLPRSIVVLLLAVLPAAIACARIPRWVVSPEPTRAEVEALLETGSAAKLPPETVTVRDIPDIPVREHLRPCCAFGSELRASIVGIGIPGYRIPNILGPGDIGPHTYDSGAFTATSDGRASPGFDRERNGLVYTCRGGFIDTAHVRDYTDWALYFAAQIGRRMTEGGEIVIPDEGGHRRVVVKPLPTKLLDQVGLKLAATSLGHWMAFQTSVWHEIATWYGWGSVPGFPERASAFSPEDLYSNMIGSKIMLAITARQSARSEPDYNHAFDAWFARTLEMLGAVPAELGNEVTVALDGLWWDSSRRLPDVNLVKRRNFDAGDPVAPWLAPLSVLPEKTRRALDEACGADRAPIIFPNRDVARGIAIADYLNLEIEPEEAIAAQEPFKSMGRSRITQVDFPKIIAVIREQARAELGPRVDLPD
jgi:hypothetical protein